MFFDRGALCRDIQQGFLVDVGWTVVGDDGHLLRDLLEALRVITAADGD
jgi:hypothetical protein